jgi:hypothetical protein
MWILVSSPHTCTFICFSKVKNNSDNIVTTHMNFPWNPILGCDLQVENYWSLNGRMSDEWHIWKDSEGSSYGLTEVLTCYMPVQNEKNHKNFSQDSQCSGQAWNKQTKKKTSRPESTSELYRPSDRRLSAMLVPTLEDRGVSCGQHSGSPKISVF